ncbi:MAG TPA: GYDIA family GHMP kinase, partial [Saprospiraceae bacterium]|nr:GYDIA family GHMP kinase [Saprospiraceae bacterium]
SMTVKATRSTDLEWVSLDKDGKEWFNSSISLYDFSATSTTDNEISEKLKKVFKGAVRLNGEFLDKWNAFKVETKLEFPREWGLGSSSTLIHLIAEWADVMPLELYYKIENGSGYDVAAAGAKGPIIFWSNDDEVSYTPIDFKPKFKDKLLFVHLNKKADSSEAVKNYQAISKANKKDFVNKINIITDKVEEVLSLNGFAELMEEHESIVSKVINQKTIKSILFSDYPFTIKSLGAWGGDFVLAIASDGIESAKEYFSSKGFETAIPYGQMVL